MLTVDTTLSQHFSMSINACSHYLLSIRVNTDLVQLNYAALNYQ